MINKAHRGFIWRQFFLARRLTTATAAVASVRAKLCASVPFPTSDIHYRPTAAAI